MATPAEYRISGFRSAWESDKDFYRILVTLFIILGAFFIFLALREFAQMLTEEEPVRYARITPGGATGLKIAGGGGGGRQGGGNGKARDAGLGSGGIPKSSLLGVIYSRSAGGQSAIGRIFGNGGLGSNVDKMVGMVKGNGGMGNDPNGVGSGRGRGFGAGELGEGAGWGGKGLGGVGTGYGSGGDNVDLGVRPVRAVYASLQQGKASVEGSLDASLIENVVKQNLAGLRYCYEKELNVTPNLAGKIVVQFTIGMGGDITAADLESTSLKNALAEDCILRRIKRWRFPKPQGGDVIVSYPFIFSPSS